MPTRSASRSLSRARCCKALIAVRNAVKFLSEQQKLVPMSRDEAYALVSMVGDCRVTQMVDIRKGIHCMIPKSIFVKK